MRSLAPVLAVLALSVCLAAAVMWIGDGGGGGGEKGGRNVVVELEAAAAKVDPVQKKLDDLQRHLDAISNKPFVLNFDEEVSPVPKAIDLPKLPKAHFNFVPHPYRSKQHDVDDDDDDDDADLLGKKRVIKKAAAVKKPPPPPPSPPKPQLPPPPAIVATGQIAIPVSPQAPLPFPGKLTRIANMNANCIHGMPGCDIIPLGKAPPPQQPKQVAAGAGGKNVGKPLGACATPIPPCPAGEGWTPVPLPPVPDLTPKEIEIRVKKMAEKALGLDKRMTKALKRLNKKNSADKHHVKNRLRREMADFQSEYDAKMKDVDKELKQKIVQLLVEVPPGSRRGNPGPRGVRGPTGRRGFRGSRGHPGPAGRPGRRGEPGLDGVTGPSGNRGYKGMPGKDGAPGIEGAAGPKGVAGPAGPAGKSGKKK